MHKLTLSVDAKVVRKAKVYARARGTSLSRLVEQYLELLTKPPQPGNATPVLSLLHGAARGASLDDYHQHLERKYR